MLNIFSDKKVNLLGILVGYRWVKNKKFLALSLIFGENKNIGNRGISWKTNFHIV